MHYALGNLEKFLQDNPDRFGPESVGSILARAEASLNCGMIRSEDIGWVIGSGAVTREFQRVMLSNPDHQQISQAVLATTQARATG